MDNVDFSVVVTHKDGVSGYSECNSDKASEIDIVKEFKAAYEKAKMGVNPVSIEPGSYTVILEPIAVGDLLGYMNYVGFSARSAQMGTGYLTGKVGQKVFGDNITIIDDVNNENTVPLYFDFEGYERKALNIIDKGVVKELAYDVRSALKDGVETTGHSVGHTGMGGLPLNLVMEGGNETLEGLIKSTKKGILVTRFHYMNVVDPRQAILTALTRDGLFLIEDGEIKSGAKNMRFTESMLNAFNNVVGITNVRRRTSGYYVPAVKIENFHFTGKTE
jgi:predicted Zn-dependent protease